MEQPLGFFVVGVDLDQRLEAAHRALDLPCGRLDVSEEELGLPVGGIEGNRESQEIRALLDSFLIGQAWVMIDRPPQPGQVANRVDALITCLSKTLSRSLVVSRSKGLGAL